MVAEPRFRELSLSAQSAYAELVDSTHAQNLRRSIANLSGSFATKEIKGRRYWYYQYRDIEGRVRQLYVGSDDARVNRLVSAAAGGRPGKLIAPRARAALALGCAGVLRRHLRIVRRLEEYGFFHAGGLLVGTHAFIALGNVLGVHWADGSRTQDIDLAHAGRNIELALPADLVVDVHAALPSLEMGFLPIVSFEGEAGATYLNPREPDLRVDFITSKSGRSERPVKVPNLGVALQPLKFIEFILKKSIQAVLLSEDGAVLVNVPDPARFAVHKLLVAAERGEAYRTKSNKDIIQAAALLSYLAERRSSSLEEAWTDLLTRGPRWRNRAGAGLRMLELLTGHELAALLRTYASPTTRRPPQQNGARRRRLA